MPTTDVQVRFASGDAPPQRFKLNRTHTVTDLLTLLERALQVRPSVYTWRVCPSTPAFRLVQPSQTCLALHPGQAAGVACRPYVLMDGFPPKPLAVSDASLQEIGLINAALTLRWS